MRKLLALLAVLTLALIAAGCGSSGGSEGADDTTTTTTTEAKATTTTTKGDDGGSGGGTAEEYAAAIATSLSSGKVEDGDLVITEEQASCVGPKIVDAVTVEGFAEAEVSVDDASQTGFDPGDLGLDTTQAEAVYDAFGACDTDLTALFAESLTAGLDPEQADCAAENADPALVKALLIKSFSSGDSNAEFEAVLADLEQNCQLPSAGN